MTSTVLELTHQSIPWVEKYRPDSFEKIVLEEKNRKIFHSILAEKHFPNLMFYGAPGGGKTTTIVNLINSYQNACGVEKNKSGSMIHLNASDDRGIDTCRNQIFNFVNSHSIFDKSLKFIVLDEVDHMTKIAQIALKYLIQTKPSNVRFCLICNYLSKIDDGLQHEFVTLRFNQLPKANIFAFLEGILEKEGLKDLVSRSQLEAIQSAYQSDIRSMINCLQTMQNNFGCPSVGRLRILGEEVLEEFFVFFSLLSSATNKFEEGLQEFQKRIQMIPDHPKNIFKRMFSHFIRYHSESLLHSSFLSFVSEVVHFPECPIHTLIFFVYSNLRYFFSSSFVNAETEI